MDWQDQLITIYLYVYQYYNDKLWAYCQRFSNYADLSCTDEYVGLTGASEHDRKVFEQLRPHLPQNELYADKAYQLPDLRG